MHQDCVRGRKAGMEGEMKTKRKKNGRETAMAYHQYKKNITYIHCLFSL